MPFRAVGTDIDQLSLVPGSSDEAKAYSAPNPDAL